jgi:hypothetical protein
MGMLTKLTSTVCRLLFAGASLLAGVAVWEKLSNIWGLTLLRGAYAPWRLLEFSAVSLLFVIALQLREMRGVFRTKDSG